MEGILLFSTAAREGDVRRVSSILERPGIDVNFTTPETRSVLSNITLPPSPLFVACQAGQLEVVRVLLKHKDIQVNFKYTFGETPLSAAAGNGYTEIMQLLIEHGADDVGGRALSSAVSENQLDAATLLLEKGTKVNKSTIFMTAVCEGHAEMVELLINHGAEVQVRSRGFSPSPLMQACLRGNTDCAKVLIEHGAEVNDRSQCGTPLLCAVDTKGHTECTKLLLEKGADVNKSHPHTGETPLIKASRNGCINDVQLLLAHNAEVNTVSSNKETALSLACDHDHIKVAEVLIENGADVNQETSDWGKSILLKAIQSGRSDVVCLLLRNGATLDISLSDRIENTLLTCAVEQKDIRIVEELLIHWAVVERESLSKALNAKSYEIVRILLCYGGDDLERDTGIVQKIQSGFLTAAESGDCKLAEILLPYVPNINAAVSNSGDTPLMMVARCGHRAFMTLLLDHGAQPNIQNGNGDTALILASQGGHAECVELLLQQKDTDVNLQNSNEHTALMVASRKGHASVVQLLLEHKDIDVNLQNSDKCTALMVASGMGHPNANAVVKLLLEHGAQLEVTDIRGWSALFYGVKSNNASVVETLLAKGADVTRKNALGKTALQFSYECHATHSSIVKMLQDATANLTQNPGHRSPTCAQSDLSHLTSVTALQHPHSTHPSVASPHPDHTTSTVVDEDSDLLPSFPKKPKLDGQGAVVVHQDTPIIPPLSPSVGNAPDTGRIYTDFHPACNTPDNLHDFSATKRWELESIHSFGLNGTGVTIAVIDAGVNLRHVAFKNHMQSLKVTVRDFVNETQPTKHGTMVAFIACGEEFSGINSETGIKTSVNPGVAPNSTLVLCNVGESYSKSSVSAALDALIDERVSGGEIHVVSMSFGFIKDHTDKDLQRIKEQISTLRQLGVIMVAAAGNYGKYTDGVMFPACLSDVISVGALNPTGNKHEWNPPKDVDVYAPGQGIAYPSFNSTNGVEFGTGSSCAAPAVSGLVALLVQLSKECPTLNLKIDLDYVKDVLTDKMKKRGDPVLLDPREYFQSKLNGIELEHLRAAAQRSDMSPRNQ